ncbi:MAG: sulfurtransferase-like selenium metabolism protein YedF [Bacillota bacterium]|nr:sulfurtransferase-like selenium metabolism protein YedF [Bacillota bacterium]
MKTIDALGIECPMPVIMAKRVIKEGEEKFLVLVDNEVATENLRKIAKQTGFDVAIDKVEENRFEVTFTKGQTAEKDETKNKAYIVVLDSNMVGQGEEAFSKKLMESFLVALTEQDQYPEYVICYNLGVELTTINDHAVEDLEKLALAGVEVLSCGLCLDNYNLKDKLRVGEITNMYRICELMTQYRVVQP